ncbi:rRNA pseudouridine synthase [Candidatus Kuenenbacteria bacterium]|nr:rRNA pseudouridine synthase [Candidatus Kuenenbacteria bacterium]
MAVVNLTQYIASSGLCSRRAAEELIRSGHVKVNGALAVLGQKVDAVTARVSVSGKIIHPATQKVYYLVNKPLGYVCTIKDRHADKKVIDLVPPKPKVWPVGRLDKDSRGLVILTNDGELTNRLTHPSFIHEKEYLLTLERPFSPELLLKLKQGVKLEEGLAKADTVKKVGPTKLSIVIHQGWNRQIRRTLGACGYRVVDLVRVRVGKVKLGTLENGKYKQIEISNF